MIHRREWPLSKRRVEKKESACEPPMNTDEHRLKADQEKRIKNKNAFVFIMFLSVFIGVHRWLKILFSFSEFSQFGVFSPGSL
jgi:hypothetical protein